MYGAGRSIAAIGRALGLPELTALAWIKKVRPAGAELERLTEEIVAARDPERGRRSFPWTSWVPIWGGG